jgi:hypothetical protein
LPGIFATLLVVRFIRTGNVIKRGAAMLWTIAVVLLLLWALGLVSSYTMGGFIHILLVLAIVVVLVRVISGRRID